MIYRIKEIGYGDKTLKIDQQNSIISKPTELKNNLIVFQEKTDGDLNNYIKNQIKFDELSEIEKINNLLYLSKLYYILFQFETIYGIIYGSQIRLLENLNSSPLAVSEVKSFFDSVVRAYPETLSKISLDAYLNFLEKNFLISISKTNEISITHTGQDFLLYLTTHRKNKNKLF